MKNEPAFPCEEMNKQVLFPNTRHPGLSKLEYASIEFAGKLAGAVPFDEYYDPKELAKLAIEQAKELIKQLEEEKCKLQ